MEIDKPTVLDAGFPVDAALIETGIFENILWPA